MNLAEVNVRGGMMARGHVRKILPAYTEDVLGPIAKRVEAQPEGNGDDDPATNKRNLEQLLASLGPNALADMRTDRLAESMTAASVQASLIGRAATPKLDEPESETATSSASRPAGVVVETADTLLPVVGTNNRIHRRPRMAAHANTEAQTMPEDIGGATPKARLAKLVKLLGMESSASAPDVLQRFVDVLEVVSMENTDEGKKVLEAVSEVLHSTIEAQREAIKVKAMSEYQLDPGMKLTACSGHVNHTLREKHLPLLSNDEQQQIDVVVPDRR